MLGKGHERDTIESKIKFNKFKKKSRSSGVSNCGVTNLSNEGSFCHLSKCSRPQTTHHRSGLNSGCVISNSWVVFIPNQVNSRTVAYLLVQFCLSFHLHFFKIVSMASVQWLSLFQSLSTVIHSCAEYYLRWFLWHVGNTSAVIHQQNNDFISLFISDDIVAFTFMSSFPYLAWLSSTTEQKHSKSQSFNFIQLFKIWLSHQKHQAGWRSRISSN